MSTKVFVMAVLFLSLPLTSAGQPSFTDAYGTLVDDSGRISIPARYRTEWTFLGSWAIARDADDESVSVEGRGASGLHNVYMQPDAVQEYRATGVFPDGAVIIKELLSAATAEMTTGIVSRGTDVEGWFILVKDTEGRFTDNRLWGDGWGWVLYYSEDPTSPVTRDYEKDCLGCHAPAEENDWIYVEGYPVLDAD